MEDFIYSLPDNKEKSKLAEAINQSKPFRKFKNRLTELPEIRDKWFSFKENRMKEMAMEWLKDNEMEIEG